MDEKELIKKTESIVATIVDVSLGKGSLLSKVPGSMARFLTKKENHDKFIALKQCYIDYLSEIDSKIDTGEEIQRLAQFRTKLINIYNEIPDNDIIENNED